MGKEELLDEVYEVRRALREIKRYNSEREAIQKEIRYSEFG